MMNSYKQSGQGYEDLLLETDRKNVEDTIDILRKFKKRDIILNEYIKKNYNLDDGNIDPLKTFYMDSMKNLSRQMKRENLIMRRENEIADMMGLVYSNANHAKRLSDFVKKYKLSSSSKNQRGVTLKKMAKQVKDLDCYMNKEIDVLEDIDCDVKLFLEDIFTPDSNNDDDGEGQCVQHLIENKLISFAPDLTTRKISETKKNEAVCNTEECL